jgi:hypothetical protein
MKRKTFELSKKELLLIQDRDFLIHKRRVIQSLRDQLLLFQKALSTSSSIQKFLDSNAIKPAEAKLSQGENYKGLPYLVLDYPAVFTKPDIIAFRTLFWWGNFFSFTLHLQGSHLAKHIKSIKKNWEELKRLDFYLSVGKTAWEYHYGADNYQKIHSTMKNELDQRSFLKMSRKIELKRYPHFHDEGIAFYQKLCELLIKSI